MLLYAHYYLPKKGGDAFGDNQLLVLILERSKKLEPKNVDDVHCDNVATG